MSTCDIYHEEGMECMSEEDENSFNMFPLHLPPSAILWEWKEDPESTWGPVVYTITDQGQRMRKRNVLRIPLDTVKTPTAGQEGELVVALQVNGGIDDG